LETLDRKIAELASFLSPSEIFRALLEGTVAGAPRAAVFLLREGRWKGWSSLGYPTAAAQRQRQALLAADSGWMSALAAEDDVRWRTLAPGEVGPEFGQGPYDETLGLPVRVGGRTVAILIAERMSDESPWSAAALSLLCQAARLRLELDLAWRRLKTLSAPAATRARPRGGGGGGGRARPPPPLPRPPRRPRSSRPGEGRSRPSRPPRTWKRRGATPVSSRPTSASTTRRPSSSGGNSGISR